MGLQATIKTIYMDSINTTMIDNLYRDRNLGDRIIKLVDKNKGNRNLISLRIHYSILGI